jgi:hypothetical protein
VHPCRPGTALAVGGWSGRGRQPMPRHSAGYPGARERSQCGTPGGRSVRTVRVRRQTDCSVSFPLTCCLADGLGVDAPGLDEHDVDAPWGEFRRKASAIAAMALLDAASGPMNGIVIRSPIDLIMTRRPCACLSSGKNACVTATWPTTLTSNCWRRGVDWDELERREEPDSRVVHQASQPIRTDVLEDHLGGAVRLRGEAAQRDCGEPRGSGRRKRTAPAGLRRLLDPSHACCAKVVEPV